MIGADWTEKIDSSLQALGIEYDGETPERIARYHALLVAWNQHMNLTGDTDFDTSLDRHYMDSLAPLGIEGLFPKGASVIDVGSGAGFPGLPLAIARPDLQVTLLDSLNKRIGFLSAVVEELGLTNVHLLHARAEDAGHDAMYREQFDIALARAVAPLPVLCELLLPLARVGGQMICYKGPSAEAELSAGIEAARLLGAEDIQSIPIVLPAQPEWQHCIQISKKNQKTVRQYPRKAGTPQRNPLGGSGKTIE